MKCSFCCVLIHFLNDLHFFLFQPIYFNEHRLNVEEKKRPKDNRLISGDNRVGPPRGGPSPRVGVGGRGPRGNLMPQGTGRGDNRGGMRGSYAPRR